MIITKAVDVLYLFEKGVIRLSLTIINSASYEQLTRQHGEALIRDIGFRSEKDTNALLHLALERAAKEKMDQNRRIIELEGKLNKVRELLNDYQSSGCRSAEECSKCGIDCALRELELLLTEN